MTLALSDSRDLTLAAFRRVAWDGEDVELGAAGLRRMSESRRAFEAFLAAHEGERLYGITTAHHSGARTLLSGTARAEYARRIPATPASFGPPLPERLVRGIVVARLAGFLSGASAVRPALGEAVAAMLQEPMPRVPARGHGDSGEIIVLRAVFGRLEERVALETKEGMALINGAPAAAAALADGTLAAGERLGVAEELLALALEAARAPHAHLDPALEAAWSDPYEQTSLRRLRQLLEGGHEDRGAYQAAVAFRNVPRLAGWLRRVHAQAQDSATVSLAAPGDNPLFAAEGDGERPARILSNAGYHDPRAAPTLNALALGWAEAASLGAVLATRLAELPDGLLGAEAQPAVSLLSMTALGWAEEARLATSPTLISLGGSPPSDTSSPALLAWRLAEDAGTCLQAVLAVLAVLSAHTIYVTGRRPPPGLAEWSQRILEAFPPDAHPSRYGESLQAIADQIEHTVHPGG